VADSQISRIQELIDNGAGDASRLQHIKDTLEKGKKLYDSDQTYLDSLLNQYFAVKENPVKKDSITIHEDKISQDHEEETIQTNDEITILKKKVESLEYNIKLITKKKKISYGSAIAGAVLLAVGIAMVSFGMIAGSSFLLNPGSSGLGYGYASNDSMVMLMGWVIFWIGLIPTIVGVRWIAKA